MSSRGAGIATRVGAKATPAGTPAPHDP
jgi:hypothetical protein